VRPKLENGQKSTVSTSDPYLPPLPRTNNVRNAHSTGLKIGIGGDRPTACGLRDWAWGGDGERDHSLYDGEGLTIARIVLEGDGRYHLRTPIAIPRQSWRDLDAAMHGAESLALAAMPPPPKLAAHIKKIDATPHPMGPPLDRQHWEPPSSRWTPAGADADVPDIPDFLKRTLANSRAVPTAAREGPPDAINLGRSSSSSRSKETSNVDAHIHGALARNNPAALDRDTGGEDLRREPTLGTANPL
jgi:hypothetical protein